ncbi:unnamed protein product, partial [Mesorhabditis belari]|uniref:Exonuclease domain-containing protein n=1 Tax=Mesorhabditis belari TaxID=2138241 RepID=A0AAF3ENA2_9BILA
MFPTDVYRKVLCPRNDCKRPYCPFYHEGSTKHQSTLDGKSHPWLHKGSSLWKLSHFDFVPVPGTKCNIEIPDSGSPSIVTKPIAQTDEPPMENGIQQIPTTSNAPQFFPSAQHFGSTPPRYEQITPVYTPSSAIHASLTNHVIKDEPDNEVIFMGLVKKKPATPAVSDMVTSTTDDCVALLDKKLAEEKRAIAEMEAKLAEYEEIERRKAELKAKLDNLMLGKNQAENSISGPLPEAPQPQQPKEIPQRLPSVEREEVSRPLKKKPAIEVIEEDFSEDELKPSPSPPSPPKRSKLNSNKKAKTIEFPPRNAYVSTPLEELKRIEELKEKRNVFEKNYSTDQKKIGEKRPSTSSHQPKPLFEDRKRISTTNEFMQDLFAESDDFAKPKSILKKDASRVAPSNSDNGKLPKKTVTIHRTGSASTSKHDEIKKKSDLTEARMNAAKKLGSQQAQRPIRPVDHVKKPPNPVAQLGARLEKAAKFASTAPKTGSFTGHEGKGSPRVAHVPTTTSSTPRLLEPTLLSCAPMQTRLTCVKSLYAEMEKKYGSQASMEEAMEEELKILKSSMHLKGYEQKIVSARIRICGASSSSSVKRSVSHQANLIGPKASEISMNIKDKRKSVDMDPLKLTTEMFYQRMKKYKSTADQLQKNSYPNWIDDEKIEVTIPESQWDTAPGREGRDKRFIADYILERHCARCGQRFFLSKNGEIVDSQCFYHPLRMRKKRENKTLVPYYPCCDAQDDETGCSVARGHVSESLRQSDLLRFREFDKPTGDDDPRSKKVYALDCEMVYTVWGPALARVSVVDRFDKLVLDVKVLPDDAIVCPNSRFSGLTIDELKQEGKTWDAAQKALDRIINDHTILIGHSLESDLKAMRIVHKRVIDTAQVFPHKFENHKWSLKDLATEKLLKIIQEDVDGHDSKEDASTCMQLMMFREFGKN